MKVYQRLRDLREDFDKTQEELAKMVGTTRQTIIAVEKGAYCPSAKLAYLLCIALQVSFEEAFYF